MSYTTKQLADLAGVSVRTLQYYDRCGLLHPVRAENDYRVFGPAEVDRLQQILLYRELGFALGDIRDILDAPGFDQRASLRAHLRRLEERRQKLEMVSASIERMLAVSEGGHEMTDQEKFEDIKRMHIEENERTYGAELRARYGDAAIDGSMTKVAGMSEERWAAAQRLEAEIGEALCGAAATGDPAGPESVRLCQLHREWLCLFWAEGTYTLEAHRALGEGYVADARFKAYYDRIVEGGAAFLRDALNAFCA
jgi:MerR family transcriptional regulator, thiopeptide resistance regulator